MPYTSVCWWRCLCRNPNRRGGLFGPGGGRSGLLDALFDMIPEELRAFGPRDQRLRGLWNGLAFCVLWVLVLFQLLWWRHLELFVAREWVIVF